MKEAIITIIIAILVIVGVVIFLQRDRAAVVFEEAGPTPLPLTEGDTTKDIEEDLDNLQFNDDDPDLSGIEEELY